MESGELVFLRYAFPVIGYCSSSSLNLGELPEFEKMLRSGGHPSRKRLEQLFPNAVKHLKSWEYGDVRDYWLREHNEIVNENFRCRVYIGRVKEILEENGTCRARVKINKAELFPKSYIPLEKGDLVSIHGLHVAEKLSKKDVRKYFGFLESLGFNK